MAQKVLEGTGEKLAVQIAAFGQRHHRVTVQSDAPSPAPFDPDSHQAIVRRFAELTAGTTPLPSRSFTSEDFYDLNG